MFLVQNVPRVERHGSIYIYIFIHSFIHLRLTSFFSPLFGGWTVYESEQRLKQQYTSNINYIYNQFVQIFETEKIYYPQQSRWQQTNSLLIFMEIKVQLTK